MRRSVRRLLLLVIPALAGSIAMAPGAVAQTPSPAPPTCSLLTADEVAAAFAVATVTIGSWSNEFDCEFSGDVSLDIDVRPGSDLAETKTGNPEGADLTVAGFPAWLSTDGSSTELSVDAGEQILRLDPWSVDVPEDMTAEALRAALTSLAELALPRLPAGPDPEEVARIRALVPATIAGEAVTTVVATGELLLGNRGADDAAAQTFLAALADQGLGLADMLVGVASVESGAVNVVVIEFPGADASSLLPPFLGLLAFGDETPEATTTELGGKQVTKLTLEPPIYTYTTGDLAVIAGGPDASLAELFAALP
jgi:hypothetical protein